MRLMKNRYVPEFPVYFSLFLLIFFREAARECRRKKKEYIKCLENRVAVLENQNKALIDELKALKELYCQQKIEWLGTYEAACSRHIAISFIVVVLTRSPGICSSLQQRGPFGINAVYAFTVSIDSLLVRNVFTVYFKKRLIVTIVVGSQVPWMNYCVSLVVCASVCVYAHLFFFCGTCSKQIPWLFVPSFVNFCT